MLNITTDLVEAVVMSLHHIKKSCCREEALNKTLLTYMHAFK